jgi:transposase
MGGRKVRIDRAKMRSPGRPPVLHQAQRRPFWQAVANGRSSEEAAQIAGVSQAVGTRWFRECGGMPPLHLSPSSPVATGRYLSLTEREEIALLRVQGNGVREIARQLERAASTISRELRRNVSTRSGCFGYRATAAQWHADRAARRPKRAKLTTNCATALCPRPPGWQRCHTSGEDHRWP